MPTIITLSLNTSEPLFFDEMWPLEAIFFDILGQSPQRETPSTKPYTLSPIRRAQGKRRAGAPVGAYQWRISLLDDALRDSLMQGLEAAQTLELDGKPLTISGVAIEECGYEDIIRLAQEQTGARPDDERSLKIEFLTPAVLYRSGLPMPLPDPPLVFEHYLRIWDTFAPRELRVNYNLLDAVAFHVAVTEQHTESRRVRLAGGGTRVGCLGSVMFTAMGWRKLGPEFLERLHMLARFANFCGTGELTANGLGQTRYEGT